MYCQSCGAKNSDEAKFCNQCGTRIAAAGEAAGPLADGGPGQGAPSATLQGGAPTAQPPGAMPRPNAYHPDTGFGGPSMMSVSLASIGVKSTKKVWLGIVLIGVALVALGWLGAWLSRGEPEVVVEAGHAEPDDPFVIGAPLPEGVAPPEVDIVSGSEGTPGAMALPSMSSVSAEPASAGAGATPRGGPSGQSAPMRRRHGSSMGTSAVAPTSMTASTTTSPATMGPSAMSGPSAMEPSSGSSSAMAPTEGPDERDLELDLYSSRVRYVIRRYYASRAQACFDRATRNAPTVSGTVVVSMTIGANGHVSRARTTRNTTGDESLGQCLQAQVSTWRLPPPPGGSLDMQMPFSR